MENAINSYDIVFKMGKILLESGAEITRVHETMDRVASSLEIEDFNTFIITNAILASGVEKGKTHSTKIKFIPSYTLHLAKISAINQLSREIYSGSLGKEDAYKKLLEIENMKFTSTLFQIISCGLASACFCYIFGGNLFDSANALFAGLLIQAFLCFTGKFTISKFIINISASMIGAFSAIVLLNLGLGENLDLIITASIIRLVPGVALTTSIRDFFNSDYLSGTVRLIDAIITGGCIAIGVGVIMSLFNFLQI